MASQPKVGEKKVFQMQFCSVHDQQKGQVSAIAPSQNTDAVSSSMISEMLAYIDKWQTYTNSVVGTAIELMQKELAEDAGKVEQTIKKWLDNTNHLPDTIIEFLKNSYQKFKQIILEMADATKRSALSIAQKMLAFFEKTFTQLKHILINQVIGAFMRASAAGQEKIANFIYNVVIKVTSFLELVKTKLLALSKIAAKLFTNFSFFNKIKGQIDIIVDFLGAVISKFGTVSSRVIGNISEVLGKFAIVFDLLIKLGKTIYSAINTEDFSDTGLDSFWYNMAALIITVIIFLIGLVLVKLGFVIAAFVLLIAGIGFGIYEVYSGVDLLALSLAEPIRNLWKKITELYEEIKQKINSLPEAIVREIYGMYGVPWF